MEWGADGCPGPSPPRLWVLWWGGTSIPSETSRCPPRRCSLWSGGSELLWWLGSSHISRLSTGDGVHVTPEKFCLGGNST